MSQETKEENKTEKQPIVPNWTFPLLLEKPNRPISVSSKTSVPNGKQSERQHE